MTEPRYRLRYAFDAGSGTCLWSADAAAEEAFGYAAEPERLPLSPETVRRLHQVAAWHGESLNRDYPPDPGPWRQEECDRFNQAARELLEEVRRELGEEFTVEDAFGELAEDPDLDAYLADPKGFRRMD